MTAIGPGHVFSAACYASKVLPKVVEATPPRRGGGSPRPALHSSARVMVISRARARLHEPGGALSGSMRGDVTVSVRPWREL